MPHQPIATLLLLLSLLTLVACTPSHTVQTTELYARKVGVTNQYEISRWHNRRIASDNRLLIAVSQPGELQPALVTQAVARPLSAFFAKVEPMERQLSTPAARREAIKRQYDFLLDVAVVEMTEPSTAYSSGTDADTHADPAEQTATPSLAEMPTETLTETSTETQAARLRHVIIEIALIDVVSGKTVDKIFINTRASYLNPMGASLENLLSGPLTDLARDLIGV